MFYYPPQMCEMVEASQTSTQDLQVQIDEYKEKNRRELAELQRQLQERGVELENSRMVTRKLQEEVWGGVAKQVRPPGRSSFVRSGAPS